MPSLLADFYEDLDAGKLRIRPPSKFLFLCGGTIGANGTADAESLRDYLFRLRSCSSELKAEVVRAETANQLYRDTNYSDLISFEEDIARISTIVLVIAESPGSLAELGAFASNDTMRKALRVIVQRSHWGDESFIRFGPLQRIHKDNEDYVGVFPWQTIEPKKLDLASVETHYDEMVKFINRQIDAVKNSLQFPEDQSTRQFYIIYWIVYLAMAIPLSSIVKLLQEILPDIQQKDVKNLIYCMKIAGWIDTETYSGKTYYFVKFDKDPFDYAFKEGVSDSDSSRRKLSVSEALKQAEGVPKHVLEVAYKARA